MGIKGAHCSVRVERSPTGVQVAKAWGTSRPNDETSKLSDVIKIDVPVNELEDFILVIKAPIIIREMLFTFRDHVAWARTSRVDNLDEWEVANGYEEYPEVRACYEEMQRRKATESQDNFREMLPLVYMTEFTIKLSARTVVRIHDSLYNFIRDYMVAWQDRDGPDPFLAMLSEFGLGLKQAIMNTPYKDLPLDAYGNADLFPKLQNLPRHGDKANIVGDFVHVYLESIPIVLRAQIVRHRPIMFTDTMLEFFHPANVTAPVASRISLSMVMPHAMAVSMLKKRNCWIAQEDLWLPVIKAMNNAFGDDGAFMLPCDGKDHCPVGRDNLLRHEGKDPAPACPLWYDFNAKLPSGEQRAAIMGYMDKRSATKGMWQNLYMTLIPDEGA